MEQFDWMAFQDRQKEHLSFLSKSKDWIITPEEHAQGHNVPLGRPLAWGGYHDRHPDAEREDK